MQCTLILLVLSLKKIEARGLWEPALPEIFFTTTDKEAPINFDKIEPKVQISSLSGTLYSRTLSQLHNVSELRIIRNQIREIDPGALCPTKDLKVLELDLSMNRQPPILRKNTFEGCDLDELFLKFDYNDPSTIEPGVFEEISNLKTLGIDSLVVPHLTRAFLKVAGTLTTLILSNVHVRKIEPDVFSDFANLEKIEIVHNLELTGLPQGLFRNLSKVKSLSLEDNRLKNLSWDEFEGLVSLEELNVVDNQITYFDADKIAKNMPNIQKIYMDMNPVGCEHKEHFVELMIEKLQHSFKVPGVFDGSHRSCEEGYIYL